MALFYREKGDPTLPPLIILHGLWGASDNWLPVAGLLCSQFHVILPDMRNHGRSRHRPEHDYESMAEDIDGWITCLNLPVKPYMLGHSMGGKVLMHLLLNKPEVADKAVIADIAPRKYSAEQMRMHAELLRIVRDMRLQDFQQWQQLQNAVQQLCPQQDLQQLLLKNIRKSSAGFQWKINVGAIGANLQKMADWPLQKSRYTAGILFLKSEHSDYIQPSDLAEIHKLFPAAMLQCIPEASHWVHRDQPIRLAHAVAEFFSARTL